jgi:PAS domain S-box-containing protein
MRLSCRMTCVLFEASERSGIAREELTRPLGLDGQRLSDPRQATDWATLVSLMDRLSLFVDHEPERIRAVGRKMVHSPVYAPLRIVAEQLVSPRAFYEMAFRWIAPAGFPHIEAEVEFPQHDRMHFRAELPEPHAASKAFFHLTEGCVVAGTEMLGLPAAIILDSVVTPRSIDMVVMIAESPWIGARVVRRLRGLVRPREALRALEVQRLQLEQAMEAVVGARDELRVVLDRFPDLVLVHRDAKIAWANQALLRALGYANVDEILGKTLFDIALAKSWPELEGRMRAAREGSPAALDTIEVWLRGPNGHEIVAEVPPAQEVIWGSVPGRLVVGRDITERVRMQQRLLTADRLASVGLLGAGVAHEMNNPLAYVLVNIEMARKDLGAMGSSGERGHQALTIALEGVDRMRTIVRDLLVLSRGETVATGLVDVGAVVDSTLSFAGEEIRRKARLVRDSRPAPQVRATDARVAQIVLNLVSNALQAMSEDPHIENEIVVTTALSEDNRVLLEVRDNGVGIPAEHLPRVFEPFFTTKDGRGTGLGLPISQRLVLELGGEIVVQSSVSGGTSVRVLLPSGS